MTLSWALLLALGLTDQMLMTAMRIEKYVIAVVLMAFAGVISAKDYLVPVRPAAPFPDPEASTNVAFNASRNDTRRFGVTLEHAGSVSNCVDVAFGRDADGDGDLAPEESDLVLGWSGGVWALEDVASDCRYEESAVDTSAVRRITFSVATDGDLVPVRAGITNETGACFTELAAESPRWFFRPEWNLMKVTRRGLDTEDSWCRVESVYNHFSVIVR